MGMARLRVCIAVLATLMTAGVVPAARQDSRLLWTPPRDAMFWGSVSADGRYLAYASGDDLRLHIRDLQSGVSRALTTRQPSGGVPGGDAWAFSRDSRRLAYSWAVADRQELRVLPVAGAQTSPRTLFADPDVRWVTASDWLPDGGSIVAGVWRRGKQESELGVLSLADASYRVLVTVPGAGANNQGPTATSPDGKFVAYSPRESGKTSRDILLVPMVGGPARGVLTGIADDSVVGWSPDGRELVYVSALEEKRSLKAVMIAGDGTPGVQRVLLDGFQPDDLLGLTARGELVYRVEPEVRWRTAIAEIDFKTGNVLSRAATVVPSIPGASLQPDGWSPDGATLALRSTLGDEAADYFAVVRDQATGQQKQVRPQLAAFQKWFWSPDGNAVVVRGAVALNQCCGVFRMDPTSGAATQLAPRASAVRGWTARNTILFDIISTDGITQSSLVELDVASGAERVLHRWSGGEAGRQSVAVDSSGRTLFYRSPEGPARAPHRVVARDLATGRETELVSGVRVGALTNAANGRFAMTSLNGELVLLPAGGGPPLAVPAVDQMTPEILMWAADGAAFLGRTTRASGESATARYWWVPLDGRAPRLLDLGIGPYAAGFVVHGSRIAFGERLGPSWPPEEVRVMNVFPRGGERR